MHTQAHNERILLAITGALTTDGGIAKVTRMVLRIFIEEGYVVDVLALTESADESEALYTAFGVETYQAFGGNKLRFSFAVWRQAIMRNYAFIFCDHVNLASILMPLGRLRLARYMVHVHGDEIFPERINFEGKLGLNSAWRSSSSSSFTRDCVLQQFPKHNIKACPLGLDPEQTEKFLSQDASIVSSQKKLQFQAIDGHLYTLDNKVILTVGRLSAIDPHKGHDILIRSMPEVLEKHPSAQLVIAGKGDDSQRLMRIGKAFSPEVQKAIFLPGYVEADILDELYAQCMFYAMPSWAEGFGLVYLEAMSWSKACLGSSVDAARDIIQHNKTGWLVDNPHSVAEVTKGLLSLLDNPQITQIMGSEGFQVVKEKHLYQHFKQRFLTIVRA